MALPPVPSNAPALISRRFCRHGSAERRKPARTWLPKHFALLLYLTLIIHPRLASLPSLGKREAVQLRWRTLPGRQRTLQASVRRRDRHCPAHKAIPKIWLPSRSTHRSDRSPGGIAQSHRRAAGKLRWGWVSPTTTAAEASIWWTYWVRESRCSVPKAIATSQTWKQ